MDSSTLRFTFNASGAEANRLVGELEDWLKFRVDGLTLKREKVDAQTQDLGSVLIAVLAAPSVVALSKGPAVELAKGISDWLRKRRTTISIGADGSVMAENVKADDVERVILQVLKHMREQ
jgi:hypothetical protein